MVTLDHLRLEAQRCKDLNRRDVANSQRHVKPSGEKPTVSHLDWTALDWDKRGTQESYKNAAQLAMATYNKQLLHMKSSGTEAERIEDLARSVSEAERKRFKRRTQTGGGNYIDERNRQYNLKLDREYGKP